MSKLQQMKVWIPNDLFRETYDIKNDFIIKEATVDRSGLEITIIGADENIQEMDEITASHWNIRKHNLKEALEKLDKTKD